MKETEQTLLERIKDQVAKEKGYDDWETMENWFIDHNFPSNVAVLLTGSWKLVCERFATAKAQPKWYSKQEMYDDLIRNNYSRHIAEELSERWAMDLENARNAGIEKGRSQVQASCEATLPEEKKEEIAVGNDGFGMTEGSTYKKSEVFPNDDKPHSFTESAYKEGESSEPQEKYTCVDCGAEMSEGERKTFTVCDTCWDKAYAKFKPVSAPSESQEELWIEVSNVFTVAGHGDAAHNHLLRRYTITRNP